MIKINYQRFNSGNLFGILTAIIVLIGLFIINLQNYLLFHTLVELFIITVACASFMLAWNARRYFTNNYLLLLSISFLFNALLELLHALSYKGMNLFQGITANEPTQLWIATGFLKSLSFLILPFIPKKKLYYGILFLVYIVVTIVLIASIFLWKSFPACYIEGVGLTEFKITSEFIVAGLYALSMFFLIRIRDNFNPKVLNLLLLSILLNIAAEMAFIFYVDVYGPFNMFGHFFLLISYYLIYKAIIETGLKHPLELVFHDLQLSKEQIKQHANKLEKINLTLQHEITERKLAEDAVTKYAKELHELNQQKNRLFSIISHDLRNPFVGLLSLSKALAEKPQELSKKQIQDYSGLLYSSAKVLYGFINSLLKWANIQTGKMNYKPIKLNLCKVSSEILNMLKGNIVTKEIEIVNNLNENIYIESDENYISTILENILSNAIKFTRKGGRIEINSAKKGKFIEISVRDNGVGIHPDDVKKLFQIDQGFSTAGTMNEEGAGLGLVLCKEMVTKGGGEIWVESKEGAGSCFYFTVMSADMDLEKKQNAESPRRKASR